MGSRPNDPCIDHVACLTLTDRHLHPNGVRENRGVHTIVLEVEARDHRLPGQASIVATVDTRSGGVGDESARIQWCQTGIAA